MRVACYNLIADVWVQYQPEIKHLDGLQQQIFQTLKASLVDQMKVI